MLKYFIYLAVVFGQPCSPPTPLLTTAVTNICPSSVSTTIPLSLTSSTDFTIGGWFQISDQSTTQYSLFRLSTNAADVTGTTTGGIRVALLIQNTQLNIQYTTTTLQLSNTPCAYQPSKWFFAAASVSYSLGKINYYLWQPLGNLQIAQLITLTTNFNSPLGSTTLVNIQAWGSFQGCGKADQVYYYDGYSEQDTTHNWLNLAFMNTTATPNRFRLEDQTGQIVKPGGYLGSTKGIDTNDPLPGYFATFTTGQFITLPSMLLASSHMNMNFWFWSNTVIQYDADTLDAVLDYVVFRRIYNSQNDQLGIQFISNGANYQVKVRLHSIFVTLTPIVSASTWTFISVSVAFLNSVYGVPYTYVDSQIGGTSQSHFVTSDSSIYQESQSDQIYIGDSRNSFTSGSIKISNFQIIPTYSNYQSASSVKCLPNCKLSSNTLSQQVCLKCSNYESNGVCLAACVSGSVGVTQAAPQICALCSYKCATCLAATCASCNGGYYLQGTNCVVASSCTATYLANPYTNTCTLCGNGVQNGAEACDDGNFNNTDGCSNCQITTGYSCSVTYPSVCVQLCGNGIINAPEQCDSGLSYTNGCVSCQIQTGYSCSGSPSVCTLLCGNNKRDTGEGCDDGNYKLNDGCSHCVVDFGYTCSGGTATTGDTCSLITPVVTTLCGNGIVETGESCDDNNVNSYDGCTNCQIDWNYKCINTPNPSVCTAISPVCGDGYRSSQEQCEDGNLVNGDGCSSACLVETGYICVSGVSPWTATICSPICGDGIVISPEQCDSTPNCTNTCIINYICGNGILEGSESCDDGNQITNDGCTNCVIDTGFYCYIGTGTSTSLCKSCITNCSVCTSLTCTTCNTGYSQLIQATQPQTCVSQCPLNYYSNAGTCTQCPSGCLHCNSSVCTQCQYNMFLIGNQCANLCPIGYYPSVMPFYGYYDSTLSNQCLTCDKLCINCQASNYCINCALTYYPVNGICTACNFDPNCIHCTATQCTECTLGYEPSDTKCNLIPDKCGDSLKSSNEQCDNGNQPGCIDCLITNGWSCSLQQNQGPSLCFELVPLAVTTYYDNINFDSLFVHFSRPLNQSYNFTSLEITIPDIIFTSNYTLIDSQNLQIKFQFNVSIQNMNASLNFTQPNNIVDIFNYSLVGLANATYNSTGFGLIVAPLNYFIYYDTDEQAFAHTLSIIALSIGCFALFTSIVYSYNIGDGQIWYTNSLQYIALFRFVNFRYSLHIYKVLNVLTYAHLSFIYNIFTGSYTFSSAKFQLDNYPSEFLLGAGGRFISMIVYLIVAWLIVIALCKLISWELILNRLEEVKDYFKFQAFLRLLELMFSDICVQIIQARNFNTAIQIISLIFIVIFIFAFFIACGLVWVKIVKNNEAVKLDWLHQYCSCIYDGYDLRSPNGRKFIYVNYAMKFIFALTFISSSAIVQIAMLVAIRVIWLPVLFKLQNPFTSRFLIIRTISQAIIDAITGASFLVYIDQNASPQQITSNGWLIFMAILVNMIHFSIWNIVLLFFKLQAPNYLIEEAEAENALDENAVTKSKKSRLKLAREFDQNIKVDEEEDDQAAKRTAKVMPAGFEENPKLNVVQVAPIGYEAPLKISQAQVAPMKDLSMSLSDEDKKSEQQQPQLNKSKVQQSQFNNQSKVQNSTLLNTNQVNKSAQDEAVNRTTVNQTAINKSSIQVSNNMNKTESEIIDKQQQEKSPQKTQYQFKPPPPVNNENIAKNEDEQLLNDFFG